MMMSAVIQRTGEKRPSSLHHIQCFQFSVLRLSLSLSRPPGTDGQTAGQIQPEV